MTAHDFDPVERFVVGTVGPPGQRVFFLQARTGSRLASVSLEKVQVSLLAERLGTLIEASGVESLSGFIDNESLEAPIEDEFRVQAIGLQWDGGRERVVIECHDHDPEDEEQAATGQSMRVVLTAPQVLEFCRRAEAIVSAGRPPCPFCGQPLDPTGHLCPRANGYKR